jgi:nucleoside-diphosphate kinase
MEKTLVIFKPDAVNRGVLGEIIERFENKGLKIVALKMKHLDDPILDEHYAHLKDKSFFGAYKKFMMRAPSLVMILEGNRAIEVVRAMAGPTFGVEAAPGTIRGDYSMSQGYNIIHASDSPETAGKEIKRFFAPDEIFTYQRVDWDVIYSEDERA